MKISVMIDAGFPSPDKMRAAPPPGPSVEDQIHDLICMIESHKDSNVEWKTLKRFYSQLSSMGASPRVTALKEMIKPILSKYGFHVA